MELLGALSMNNSHNKPAASVILPVYNAGKYLDAAVESILSQTFRDFELLLLNDGSTDGSLSRLEYYAGQDSRCKVFTSANRGLVGTLNEGIRLAAGDILIRMDQDDISHPERFEEQMGYLKDHPDCVLVGSRVQLIDPDGMPIMQMGDRTEHEDIDEGLSWGGAFIFHPAVAMRKSAVLKIGGYRAEYEYADDLDLFLRLAEVGRLTNLQDVLVDYRQHPSSMSYSGRDRQFQSILAATSDARRRRGQVADTSSPDMWSSNAASATISEVHRKWAWWALASGNLKTARKHAWKALLKNPFSLENFKVCACVLRGF
jgi:glycosyltransferase involved in cell wall biosynthesis